MVNCKWLPDFIERLKASAWHQLYLPLFCPCQIRVHQRWQSTLHFSCIFCEHVGNVIL